MNAPLDAVYEAASTVRLRDEVAFACRVLHRLGLAPSHASARVAGTALIAVKARGGNAGGTSRDDVILVDGIGTVVAGAGAAPAELPLHLAVYAARPDVAAVAHTHQPTAVSRLDARPDPAVPTLAYPGLIDTPELGRALANALGAASAVHLRTHGFAIVGPDLETTIARAAALEAEER